MKIQSYNSYKVNFGYDKKLNQELRAELKTLPDRKWADTLSSLNSQCNKLESNIREESISTTDTSKLTDYIDLFISQKQMLAAFVGMTFENLNFADREYNHYYDEFRKSGSRPNDWRKDVCDAIAEWCSPIVSAPSISNTPKTKNPKDELFVPKFDEDGVEIVEEDIQPVVKSKPITTSTSLSPKSLLEQYTPNSESPKGFDDVKGMQSLKKKLNEGIINFIRNPQQAKLDFENYGKKLQKSILLYGPPGCGKTYIVQALAQEMGMPLYMLNLSKSGSSLINATSKNIKSAFDEAVEIAEKTGKPCILFMDEVDSIAFNRTALSDNEDIKQVATLLQCMDKAKDSNVIVLAATNKYNLLDPAVKRRFQLKEFVDVPDNEAIEALLQKSLTPLKKGQVMLNSPEQIKAVSQKLKGFSCDSICKIAYDAATVYALEDGYKDISPEHFYTAISNTTEEKPNRKEYMPDDEANKRKIGF